MLANMLMPFTAKDSHSPAYLDKFWNATKQLGTNSDF
jgi:hypothetical protein